MNEEQQKLYDVLVREGYYTKSFDEFQTQFQDSAYQDKVFGVVERDGLFTKGKDSFLEKYAVAEKKKDDTEFVSEVGSSEPPAVEGNSLLARHDSLEQTYMDAWKRMQDIQALDEPTNQQIQELQELNTTFTTALNEYNQVADQIRSEAPKGQDPAERVRNLRQGVSRKNEGGGRSTVKMADMEVDGKFVAVPTLFPKDPNNYGPNPEDWVEFGEDDAMGAYDMALERGEVFEFDTPEEAREFAKGSWKEMEEEPPKDEFNKSLEFVNNRLIDRSDAGQVARELEYEFGDFGFNFDRGFEVGIGNYIKVTAANGETIDVNTNPQFLTDEDTQADLLRDFLVKNRGTTPKREVEQSIDLGQKELDRLKGVYEQTHGDYERAAAKVEEYRQRVQADESVYDEAEAKRLVEAVNAAAQADQKAVDEYNAVLNIQNAEIDELNRIAQEKRDEPDAFERTFGKNAVTDLIADNTYRPIIQGQAQAGTIRSSYDLLTNANDVTDEDIADFLRAQEVLEEYGPSDEMRDFQRAYQEAGGGWGGFVSAFIKRPPPLGELFVSSVSMMANEEVAKGALLVGAAAAPAGLAGGPLSAVSVPAAFLTGAMGGAGATLEAGISFAEFLRDEMAEKQGVDPEKVVMNNEKIREVLSDPEAMSRIRYRAGGRGIAIGVTSLIGTGVAATATRRTAIKTGSKLKAAGAGAAVELPFEGLGETAGQLVAGQELDAAEIGLEAMAGGPAQVVGVGIGLFKTPEYTLNGELVTGKQMADFIREADEADVAGATIEIKNDDTLAKQAHDKRDNARERVVIKEQLRKSGVENEETVDKLADLELEKRKLKGLETTAAERKRTRIQNEIDAILDGDSYFFEETTDEKGNKRSKEVRVTRRDALLALAEDDVLNPTEKEIEAKQAELFRDALADIQESDAVQEPSTEEVDVGEQARDGEEVGVGDTEVVAEEEAVVDEEAEELEAAFEAESTPDVEEDIDGVTVRRREGYEFGRKAQRVLDQAKKRVKSLENFGVNIVLHENDAQFGAATNSTGRGLYDSGTKTIHINLDKANSRTVAHEAFHALFLERVKGDDAKAQQWAKATMKSVRKALDADSVLATRIDDFLTRYEENVIDEEALAEIFGYLSEGYGELTAPQQSRVKAAIRKLFELIGVKLEAQWSQDDQNVIDVFNMLARKMERGEEITEAELAGLDVSEEKAKEVAEETTVDSRIAGLQEKRQEAERSAVQDTDLSKLDGAIGRTGDSAAQRVYNKLFKSVRTGKLRSLEKQMREANKSKKMSAEDKEARIDKLEQQYNNELERLAKAREDVKARVEQELKRLEPEIEKAAVKERLAEIREEQRAITQQLAKDKREAKRVYEGEERKEYVKGLTEEAEAKRAALRDEIAELRGEKKKDSPGGKTEAAPVEETPVVEEAPTVGTIRTKVGVEAFGKLEAAVRKFLEYMETMDDIDTKREKGIPLTRSERGRKATETRLTKKVNTLSDELGLTGAELVTVQRSVQEKIEAEKRAAEAKETEAAERKAAAERAKKAAEEKAPVEEEPIRSKIARILGNTNFDQQEGIRLRYKKERNKIKRRKPSEAREAALRELDVKEAAELDEMSQRYRIARNALSVLDGKGLTKAAREGSKTRNPLTREEIQQVADLAGVDVETLIEAEPTVEEELMPELTKGELAKLLKERPNLRLAYFRKDGNRDSSFTIGYSRATGKYFFSDGNRIYRSSNYDKFSQALNRLLYQKRRGVMPGEFIGLYDTNMPSKGVFAKFDLEMNNITEVEPTVEEEVTVEEAPVDDVAKRAAVEGVSVEEFTKEQQKVEREAKLNIARSEQRKLEALKGKKDKKSVAERKNIKQFIEDLKTMSVEEARAKRQPSAREQRVAANEYDLKSLKKVGEGSTRVVYDLGDGRVLKRAKNPRGLIQNDTIRWGDKNEILLELLPEVYFDEEGADYVIHENVPRNDSAVRKFLKPLKEVYDENRIPGDRYIHPKVMRQMEEMGLGEFLNYDLLMGDFVRPSSWGQRENGEFVLVDDGTLTTASNPNTEIPSFYKEDWAEVESLRRQPKAREQRVADVVERYEFRPNGSLKNASLADELRRNLKRYGFGVKQFGTRMDEFHIVNLATGRKVDPKKLIAKDRADERAEMEQRAEVRERDAKERMEREEVEESKAQELQEMQDQYVDFPEEMLSAPSRLSPRQQRESLQDNAGKFNDTALVKFAKERGYSDAAILKVRPTAQAAIDAYDAQATRLSREVQGIIQRARERARGDKKIQAIENKGQRTRAVNDRIIKDVKAYIQKSKMYEDASDVGREAMMRAVDKQMGRRIKAAPSVIKLLGLTPDGDVLIDKKGLLEQIRVMARSSKATAAASREIMREVGKDIARLKATGAISGKQATAILRKMANMDPFNPVQVENFVNYTARVFAEAEYIEEVNKLNKLRKRALKNASKKLGISPDLMPMLQTLLNMDARLVPEGVFEKYKELVNDLGERKTVLNLKERTQMFDDVVSIMSGINEELAKKEELFARYEAYTSKADSVKGKIADMVKDGELSAESELDADGNKMPSEADILLKYADELREERKMSEEEKEKAREEERAKLVDAIQRLPNLDRKFPTQMENKLVRRFNKLVRTEGLLGLSNAELKNVLRVADNIQNGFLPHTAQVLVEQVEANNRAVVVEQAIKEAKLPKIARIRALLGGVTNNTAIARVVNRNPLRFIDQVYGDYRTTRIYDAAFKDLASSYASYKSDVMGVQQRLDRVEEKLIKSLGRNPNAVIRSKFLIGAYMMQAEFDTNPNVPGVFDAVSLLDETIKKSERSRGGAYYSPATAKVLKDIRKKIDGKSAEEIRALLSEEERAVADEIRAVNDELTPKAEYVAGVLRGVPFRPFSQYFHRIVLKQDDKAGLKGVDALIDEAKTRMRKPSTKAQNIQQRKTTSPPAVNFDPFASARRGARYILTDYHMTEAVRTNARLMNKLEGTDMTPKQRQFYNAINNASEATIADALVQSYTISTLGEQAVEMLKRQGYRVVLADMPRMVGELLSNILFVSAAAGRQFAVGIGKHYNTMATNGSDVMKNVGSVQTTRLYADSKTISSRMVESIRATTGPEKSDVGQAVFNRAKQIWAYSGAPWTGAVNSLADFMITTPDKIVTRPVWFGTFAEEFKARSGKEVDFDKIAANDEAYMAANEEAIKAATDAADLASVQTGATDNPFLGIVNSFRKSGGTAAGTLIKAINSYMTRFLVFEFVTARTAINASVGNGTITKSQGVKLLSAVLMRMVAYVFITNALRDMLDKALNIDEPEDDDKTLEEEFDEAVFQGVVSLVVGGTYGAVLRGVASTGIEFGRKELMEDAGLDFEYDDSVFIPLISPAQDGRPYKKMTDLLARLSGPYNPILRPAILAGKLAFDSDKKEVEAIKRRDEEFYRLGLEVLGLAGMVPFYKDVRRVFVKEIYKDLDKDDTPENIEKRIEEELKKLRKEAKR